MSPRPSPSDIVVLPHSLTRSILTGVLTPHPPRSTSRQRIASVRAGTPIAIPARAKRQAHVIVSGTKRLPWVQPAVLVVSLASRAGASRLAPLTHPAVPLQYLTPDAPPLRGRTPGPRRHSARIAGSHDSVARLLVAGRAGLRQVTTRGDIDLGDCRVQGEVQLVGGQHWWQVGTDGWEIPQPGRNRAPVAASKKVTYGLRSARERR